MKNVFNKTTILLAVIALMMISPAGLFAGGRQELDSKVPTLPVFATINSNFPKASVNTALEGGKSKENIDLKVGSFDYGICKIDYGNSNIEYRSLKDGSLLNENINWENIFTNASPSATELTEESKDYFKYVTDPEIYSGSFSGMSFISSLTGLDGINPLDLDLTKDLVLEYEANGMRILIDLIIIKKDNSTCNRIRFYNQADFFEGEGELYGYPTGDDEYKKAAIAFMGSVLGDDFRTVFNTLYTGYSSSDIDWNMFDSYADSPTLIDYYNLCVENFKSALSASFTTASDGARSDEYVYLKNTEELRESIYGDDRNIYLSTYVKFAYKNDKPVLSQLFVDFYNEHNKLNPDNPIYYNYDLYNQITDEGGINPLARNAMRYYTWGVEYTPFSGFNTVVSVEGANEVYSTVKDLQYFKDWIAAGNSNGTRENNFVNTVYSYSGVSSPPEKTITYDTNNIGEITLKSEQANETINRIDVWSADNIAWDSNIQMNPITLEIWEENNIVLTNSISTITSTELNRINDTELYLDDSDDSSEQNLLIKRSQLSDTSNGIGIGYEFEKEQAIKAISVYRGRSSITATTEEPYMYNELEPIRVYYLDGSKWIKLQPSEFIECAALPQGTSYNVYPGTSNFKPGYGIWDYDGFHTGGKNNPNTEVSTSYLIFNSQVFTKKILLVDSSTNSFINISEMGVFNDDPVQMFDIDGTEIDYATYGYPWKAVSWSSGIELSSIGTSSSSGGLMTNGSISEDYTFTNGYSDDLPSKIKIDFKTMAPVRQVIAWTQDSANPGVMIPDSRIKVYMGDQDITESEYFYEMKSLSDSTNWSKLNKNIDTPFTGSSQEMMLGNPLPYAPLGIDSPRTFAYKMACQALARETLLDSTINSTLAYINIPNAPSYASYISYEDGYISADSLTSSSTEKPFRPGYFLNNKKGGYEDGKLKVEQSAGTDSTGLLQGALAMIAQGEFVGADGSSLISKLNTYYGMNTSNAPGLDDNSLPAFNATEANSYENIERITAADIERSTIIVPDISEIQEGDLLVKCDDDGTINTGIVVGFLSETKPAANTELSAWWNNVLVISVRPGFQSVTLGTWGNNGPIFGGFTETPEEYMIRRVVLRPSNTIETDLTTADWEAVKSLYYQRYTDYCEEGLVPYNVDKVIGDDEAERYTNFVNKDVSNLRELPPTSYSTNRVYNSVFDYNPADNDTTRMKPTSYSGWRYLETSGYIGYHRALDVQPEGYAGNYEDGDQTNIEIRAPESGKYWLIDLDDSRLDGTEYNYNVYIQIDSTNFLILDTFIQASYGDIGVLVTNPDNPRKGRVYLFAHQFASKDDGEGVIDFYNSHSSVHFTDKDGIEITSMPSELKDGGFVEAGDWLGFIGGNGGFPPHVHMEVYEFFDGVKAKYSGMVGELNYSDVVDDIKFKNGADAIAEVTVDDVSTCINWQRVDPRTVFNQSMFIDNDENADDTDKIIKVLNENPEYWPDSTANKQNKYDQFFKPWGKWIKITGAE